jgi:tetratricopeptide (TPR) repeat protein
LGGDYYQRQKYDLAMGAYESFLRDYPKHEFAPIAIVGVAHVAEAQGKTADAETRFRDFASSYPEHYLTPLAILGQARCVALQGRKDEARAILDRMMADRAGTPWAGFADDLLSALPRLEHVKLEESSFADALKALETQEVPAADTNAPAAAAATNAPAATPAAE